MKEHKRKAQKPLSLAPLTLDEAMSNLLKVKPSAKAKEVTRKKKAKKT